jgi:hypothetical protein
MSKKFKIITVYYYVTTTIFINLIAIKRFKFITMNRALITPPELTNERSLKH